MSLDNSRQKQQNSLHRLTDGLVIGVPIGPEVLAMCIPGHVVVHALADGAGWKRKPISSKWLAQQRVFACSSHHADDSSIFAPITLQLKSAADKAAQRQSAVEGAVFCAALLIFYDEEKKTYFGSVDVCAFDKMDFLVQTSTEEDAFSAAAAAISAASSNKSSAVSTKKNVSKKSSPPAVRRSRRLSAQLASDKKKKHYVLSSDVSVEENGDEEEYKEKSAGFASESEEEDESDGNDGSSDDDESSSKDESEDESSENDDDYSKSESGESGKEEGEELSHNNTEEPLRKRSRRLCENRRALEEREKKHMAEKKRLATKRRGAKNNNVANKKKRVEDEDATKSPKIGTPHLKLNVKNQTSVVDHSEYIPPLRHLRVDFRLKKKDQK